MNLYLESESIPEVSRASTPRSALVSGLVAHAVLFAAILAVQVGMVAQAVMPHASAAVHLL